MHSLLSEVIVSASTGEVVWGVLSCNDTRILGVSADVSDSPSVLPLFPKMLQK